MAESKERNNKIRLFAPSGPPSGKRLEAGLAIVRSECEEIYEALTGLPHVRDMPSGRFPWLFSEDSSQAALFEKSIRESTAFLWAMRGGYGILRWIDLVDWSAFTSTRIPIVTGFSDITCLHAVLNSRGIFTLHAPMLCTLAETDQASRAALWESFTAGSLPAMEGSITLAGEGTMRARLLGGNLCTLCHLAGTPWEPRLQGSFLFLEEINEPLYRIDRMLTHLLQSGMLAGVEAVLLGDFSVKDEEMPLLHKLFEDRLCRLEVPVVAGFPVGHGSRNMPLLLGGEYELDCASTMLQPLCTVPTPFL